MTNKRTITSDNRQPKRTITTDEATILNACRKVLKHRKPSIERFYALGSRDYDAVIEYIYQQNTKIKEGMRWEHTQIEK